MSQRTIHAAAPLLGPDERTLLVRYPQRLSLPR